MYLGIAPEQKQPQKEKSVKELVRSNSWLKPQLRTSQLLPSLTLLRFVKHSEGDTSIPFTAGCSLSKLGYLLNIEGSKRCQHAERCLREMEETRIEALVYCLWGDNQNGLSFE